MNVNQFKKDIVNRDIPHIKEKMESFKIAITNMILYYEKKRYGEEQELIRMMGGEQYFYDSDEYENFSYQYEYLGVTTVEAVYTAMNWDFSEVKAEMRFWSEADCYDMDTTFDDVWNRIKDLEPVEFFFAIVVLKNRMSELTKWSKWISWEIGKRIRELELWEESKRILQTRKVFLAMSFNPKLMYIREVVKKVVNELGYSLTVIDEKEYNDFVVPEIYKEIKESAFTIADVTQHRAGVYFEAGYAIASDKEVIFCCQSEDFNDIHFDIRHYNHIKWDNEQDLERKLLERIKAMLVS